MLGLWGLFQFHACEFQTGFELVPGGRGDNRMVTAQLEYWHQALLGMGSVLSPAYYFPARDVLGYSDAYLAHALGYHLLRALGEDPFTAFQWWVLFFNALNYIFAYLMLRLGFRFSRFSSALGAFVFAFNAPKFNQWSHTQLQFLCGLPLILWILASTLREMESLSNRRFFLRISTAGWIFSFQLLTAFYPGWLFLFWSILCLGLSLCFSNIRTFICGVWNRKRGPLLWAMGMTILGLIPFGVIYGPAYLMVGGKPYTEVQMMTPNLWTYLWMGPRHAWWGWLWDRIPALQLLPVEGEMRMGFGLALSLLVVVAFFAMTGMLFKKQWMDWESDKAPRYSIGAAAFFGTAIFCLLAFDYDGFSPWKWIYEYVPGASAVRALGRWSVVLALPLSILFSAFMDWSWGKMGFIKELKIQWIGKGLVVFFALCVLYEQTAFPPTPGFSKHSELARLERLSEKLPSNAGPFYVTVKPGLMTGSYGGPLSATDVQIDAMLISAVRGIPTLNGYSGANPPQWGLYKVRSPFYPKYVKDWVNRSALKELIFDLEIDE